jgi:D-arabinose 1-dehydrogenase-like Zn-dependent alcohol dehydrogenase
MRPIAVLAAVSAALVIPGMACAKTGQAPPPTMSAVQISEFGGTEVLRLVEVPRPEAGPGELLVRVHATAVNPVDTQTRRGWTRSFTGATLPYIPGFDVSGVVAAVGEGVTRFAPGDEVFAMIDLGRGGGYAEYVVLEEPEAARKPAGISHAEAASLPLVALTAWQALFETADLQPGQTVLIHAGAGGVGTAAIQLAKWRGARVLTTASARNHELVRSLGADVAIDYTWCSTPSPARPSCAPWRPSGRGGSWWGSWGSRTKPIRRSARCAPRRSWCAPTPSSSSGSASW